MTRLRLPLIIECLLFFVPLNIYGIGNNLATGVQWALFRYQESYLGNSLILIHRDLGYVLNDTLRGSSAFSTVIWILGAFLLVAALILLTFATVPGDARQGKTRRPAHHRRWRALSRRDARPVRPGPSQRPRFFPAYWRPAYPCHRVLACVLELL